MKSGKPPLLVLDSQDKYSAATDGVEHYEPTFHLNCFIDFWCAFIHYLCLQSMSKKKVGHITDNRWH